MNALRYILFLLAAMLITDAAFAQQPASACISGEKDTTTSHPQHLPDGVEALRSFKDTTVSSVSLGVIPFGSFAGGLSITDSTRGMNSGFAGLQLQFTDRKRWNIMAGYAFVGTQLPDYLMRQMAPQPVIPGIGYAADIKHENLYRAHYTYGSAAFRAGKHILIDVGKGKHFWGDGHRSLILSDNAAPAPYARITTSVWKLRYTNLWMQLRDLSSMQTLSNARKKYAAMHSLSYTVTKKFNVSLYEWVIWQDRDSMSRRTVDLSYANPLIFYRPVEYTLGSPDNVILAASFRWDPLKKIRLYGQFVLDEFNLNLFKKGNNWWGNKVGAQAGLRWCPSGSLCLRTEVNAVRPFTYTHGSSIQAWTHLNQAMAHPLGANFIEAAQTVVWTHGPWSFIEQFNVAAFGRDYDANNDGKVDNFGGNLIRNYRDPFGGPFGHSLLQGELYKTIFQSITVSRSVKAAPYLEFFLTHTFRREFSPDQTRNEHLLLLGIRTQGLLQPVQDY